MKIIDIVSHCYSGDSVPIYHHLLQAQLSSLVLYDAPSDLSIRFVVVYCPNDERTCEVLDFFEPLLHTPVSRVQMIRHPLPTSMLFRRAIGRDLAAKCSTADAVWFTDVDYLFTDNSLYTAVDACMQSDRNMVYPSYVNIHTSHEYGDALIRRMQTATNTFVVGIDYHRYTKRRERRAIGGIQIVKGSFCREYGYLSNTKWTMPVTANSFLSCRGDIAFRKTTGPSESVDIPGVYRVRHSRCGRDGGVLDHGRR